MTLQEELKKMDMYIGQDTEKFNAYYLYLTGKYPSEKDTIDNYIEKSLKDMSVQIGEAVDNIGVKIQLLKVYEMVSMSYIAKNYFHRTRQWLYKKVNGSLVNGKPAKFTPGEINTLNDALQDISKQLGSTCISL